MKKIFVIGSLFILGCNNNLSENDTIKREVTLREARRQHTLEKLNILKQYWVNDTLSVYYTADITFKSKDSTIRDSLFFLKNKEGVIIPLLRAHYNDK